MAITHRAFWDSDKQCERIGIEDTCVTIDGDVQIKLKNGKTMKIGSILERLEALEQAYMEDKLLGKTEEPGTMESCKTTTNK
jgi:hypothetical protein